ncbi:hypothetical protein GCM10008983_17600 [Lentibacillus halophilus]|uniref:N-acetyltransferase domain-containing protein n=1 Tax=Lentibacillus halophilus TaxID=295065 RepID=A0ABP3J4D4_9BACI
MAGNTLNINTDKIRSASLSNQFIENVDLFYCSDQPNVETFLREDALRLEESNACRTHLYFYDNDLIGFYSLFTDYVNLVSSKRDKEGWKDVATAMDSQAFPAIRLHYFGIDEKYRSQRLGELLLMLALDTCVYISNYIGASFVVLEAFEDSIGFFQKYNFRKVKRNNEFQIMAIKIDDIK